jgi:hypothetical protein
MSRRGKLIGSRRPALTNVYTTLDVLLFDDITDSMKPLTKYDMAELE